MSRFAVVIALLFSACALAQVPATQPWSEKKYRNSVGGIEFTPRPGGVGFSDVSNAEIARFVNAEASWDLHVKAVPLHLGLPLTGPEDGGVLELVKSQMTSSNLTAEILISEVHARPEVCNGAAFGVIESRYDSATDRIFSQQAIFRESNNYYVILQLNAHGKPKTDTSNTPFPAETQARALFEAMLPTVHLLDRSALRKEQDLRVINTKLFWLGVNEQKLVSVLQPQHFVRLIRDGKDIGFIQINERQTIHVGNPGIEVIMHSQVQADLVQPTNITTVVTPTDAAKSDKPSYLYTSSDYFVTFDRKHEEWTTITQLDDQVLNQITESANSDVTIHRRLDAKKAADNARSAPTTAATRGVEPPVLEIPNYTLDVAYAKGPHQDKPTDTRLYPHYLPQAIAQLLPRLLPADPTGYFFSFYVSGQRVVMSRYIDVGLPRDVDLEGGTVNAIPISDRIGVDSAPTIHYVNREGGWLGSVNDELKLQMLPTDESTLKLAISACLAHAVVALVTEQSGRNKRLRDDPFELQKYNPPGR